MNPTQAKLPAVTLKTGRESPLKGYHPWVFSGAIQASETEEPGSLVRVGGSDGSFFGIGFYNPKSSIRVRMITFKDEVVDEAFFRSRIAEALDWRKSFLKQVDTNAYRIINGEGDNLPGLVVDRYGSGIVLQVHSAGFDRYKEVIVSCLKDLLNPEFIYEKDDARTRQKEGLLSCREALFGPVPNEPVRIKENGLEFWVDIAGGQKTGFYLDQRTHRKRAMDRAENRRVLNAFCYSGGFSVYAEKGGAKSVVSVDQSREALELVEKNYELNGISADRADCVQGDVFEFLRDSDGEYDMVILDPPPFCKNRSEVEGACRGYKDINLNAFKKCAESAVVFTFSCSTYMEQDLFQKVVFGAGKDAGRRIRVLKELTHPADHPVNLYHPEGNYLKGLVLAVN